MMKKLLYATLLAAALAACQKQQPDAEGRAEVDREAQQRLAAEHQEEQRRLLDQREAELNARERSLNENETKPATPPSVAEADDSEQAAAADQEAGDYSIFYTDLQPYGDWLETPHYGYVFKPRETEGTGWRPYLNGTWVYTDAGWTWISNEPFGWATYHYGRWVRLRGQGWVWVPGNDWAPAWVSWRKGAQYIGWAPLPPEAHFDRHRGIHNWSDSYYNVAPDQYVFVPIGRLTEQQIEQAVVPAERNVNIVNQTINVTNVSYKNTMVINEGPQFQEVQAQSRAPIPRLRLQRQPEVNKQAAQPVVRGDTLIVSTPPITPAGKAKQPVGVKEKPGAAVPAPGAGVSLPEAAQTRPNIQATPTGRGLPARKSNFSPAEQTTTPSPNAPAPFVRPSAAIGASPLPSRAPQATTAVPQAGRTAPVFSRNSPSPASSPQQAIRPSSGMGLIQGQMPRSEPETTPPAATTSSSSAPEPPHRFKSVARQLEKQHTVPMSSPTISPAASVAPSASSSPSAEAQPGASLAGSPVPAGVGQPGEQHPPKGRASSPSKGGQGGRPVPSDQASPSPH